MDSREAFEAWWLRENGEDKLYKGAFRNCWQEAIAHIREHYTLCEKEPVKCEFDADGLTVELYREAKHED